MRRSAIWRRNGQSRVMRAMREIHLGWAGVAENSDVRGVKPGLELIFFSWAVTNE